MVRDDHSGYSWFYPVSLAYLETAARALPACNGPFGAPLRLLPDGTGDNKNDIPQLLSKDLNSPHDFMLPYCSWSDGAVDRLGKGLLCVARVVPCELKMRYEDSPQLVLLFQAGLNSVPPAQPRNLTEMTDFTGRSALAPVLTIVHYSNSQPMLLTKAHLEAIINASEQTKYMDKRHPLVPRSM